MPPDFGVPVEDLADGIREFANTFGTLGITLDVMAYHSDQPWEPGSLLALQGDSGYIAGLEPGDGDLLDAMKDSPPGRMETYVMDTYVLGARRDAMERIALHGLRYGDPFSVWSEEIRRMKRAVVLLDRLKSEKATPAEETFVRALANQTLAGPDIRIVLAKTRKTRKLALHIRPLSLLALMWVQYGLAVTGSRDHRHCDGCNRWFEVSAEHGHGKQGYCTKACKAAAYRKRKARARRMAADGNSLKEIAMAIGSTPKIVRGWIN